MISIDIYRDILSYIHRQLEVSPRRKFSHTDLPEPPRNRYKLSKLGFAYTTMTIDIDIAEPLDLRSSAIPSLRGPLEDLGVLWSG